MGIGGKRRSARGIEHPAGLESDKRAESSARVKLWAARRIEPAGKVSVTERDRHHPDPCDQQQPGRETADRRVEHAWQSEDRGADHAVQGKERRAPNPDIATGRDLPLPLVHSIDPRSVAPRAEHDR